MIMGFIDFGEVLIIVAGLGIGLLVVLAVLRWLWRLITRTGNDDFPQKLTREIAKWVSQDIITQEQSERIQVLYSPNKKTDIQSWTPMILISLASVLLAAGLFLFYAANWKYMSPLLKLVQVYGVIVLMYSLSYHFLNREGLQRLGRAFLILGILSFGAGIALVAQIYHITAHGGTGILVWTLGAIAMSWVMKERWGYYVAAVLSYIWTAQQGLYYQDPNYLFPLVSALLIWLFYGVRGQAGIVMTTIALLAWLYQCNLCTIEQMSVHLSHKHAEGLLRILLITHAPLGIILACLGRLCEKHPVLRNPSKVFIVLGWLLVFVPLIAMSWPLRKIQPAFLFNIPGVTVFNIQFGIFLLGGMALIKLLWQRKLEYALPLAAFICAPLLYFLPLGNNVTLVVATHLGLLGYLFCLLFFAHDSSSPRKVETHFAVVLMSTVLIVKGLGFFISGTFNSQFYLAYCIGFIIFGTVCFLINQAVQLLLAQRKKTFYGTSINTLCAVMGFLIIYVLSWEVPQQKSIFSADPIVLVLLFLFLGLALLLYGFIYLRSKEKMMVTLSAITFFIAVAVLFISGPKISWIFYSLVFNLLLFVIEGSIIYYGVKVNLPLLVNFAIGGFLVHIITRYFDLLFDMLSGSTLFIVTGALIMSLGYFLEKRRYLIEQVKQTTIER